MKYLSESIETICLLIFALAVWTDAFESLIDAWKYRQTISRMVPDDGLVPKIGWVVTAYDEDDPSFLTVQDSEFEFTRDELKAIRFCSREDAERLAEILGDEDVQIERRLWKV